MRKLLLAGSLIALAACVAPAPAPAPAPRPEPEPEPARELDPEPAPPVRRSPRSRQPTREEPVARRGGRAFQARPARSGQAGPAGKASLAIAPFTFHRNVRARPGADLETATLTQKFVTSVVRTRKFDVVERSRLDTILDEMELSEVGLTDPTRAVEAGRMLGADFLLMGEISVWTVTTDIRPVPHTGRFTRRVALELIVDMRIVNSRTSRVASALKGEAVLSTREEHRSRPAANAQIAPRDLDEVQRQLVDDLVLKVINAIYPVKVLGISGGTITVNRGEGGGLEAGQLLDVYAPGEDMVDPDTGEVLGSEEAFVARICVEQVLPKFTKASLVGGRPVKGDICRAAQGEIRDEPAPPPPSRDSQRPSLSFLSPREGATLSRNPVTVVVEAYDNEGIDRVEIAGTQAENSGGERWQARVRARDGRNQVTATAWDLAGNQTSERLSFNFDSTPPEVDGEAGILVEGTVDDLGATLTINGLRVRFDAQGRYSARVPADPNDPGRITIMATDEFGNESKEIRRVR